MMWASYRWIQCAMTFCDENDATRASGAATYLNDSPKF